MGRLLWRLITPRQLRKWTFLLLLLWLGVALVYQNGYLDGVPFLGIPTEAPLDSTAAA